MNWKTYTASIKKNEKERKKLTERILAMKWKTYSASIKNEKLTERILTMKSKTYSASIKNEKLTVGGWYGWIAVQTSHGASFPGLTGTVSDHRTVYWVQGDRVKPQNCVLTKRWSCQTTELCTENKGIVSDHGTVYWEQGDRVRPRNCALRTGLSCQTTGLCTENRVIVSDHAADNT